MATLAARLRRRRSWLCGVLATSVGLAGTAESLHAQTAPATEASAAGREAQASSPRAGEDPAPPVEVKPPLHIIGFTDLNFSATDAPDPQSNSGFSEGQFVLHFTSVLSARFTFFGETTLTTRPVAATNSGVVSFRAEVERSILKYDHSDYLKLSIGRYHTPISYWNTAFHHGQWLQTTIARPEMIQFGGAFIPVHFVGGLLQGTAPMGGANLSYDLGLGNGRSSVVSRAGDAGDVNNNRAWLVALAAKPDRFYGLQAGAGFYRDRLTRDTANLREWIASAHVAWTKETPELIAEYARLHRRSPAGGPSFQSWSSYVQAGYRLRVGKGRWKPYLRWERSRIEKDDPLLSAFGLRRSYLFGVRCDVSDRVALKSEFRRRMDQDSPFVNGIFAQVSLTF